MNLQQKRGTENSDVPFRYVSSLDEISGQTFDAINLEQVLEHIPDPLATLKTIASFCENDSFVRITVPNILRCSKGEGIWEEWPFNGSRPHTMVQFEQLHRFKTKSLEALVKISGFVQVSGVRVWSVYSLEMSRRLIGKFIPKLGVTWGMIRLGNLR